MIKLGQRLYAQRVRLGLTLDEVTKATKIRPAFLNAIEQGEYSKLPASSYAQGFVANYAEFLGLSRRETLALFRREFRETKTLTVLPKEFSQTSDNVLSNVKVRHTTLLVIIAFVVFLGYMGFSYKDAFINPPLTMQSPEVNTVKTGEILVKGKTNIYDTVTINNAPVYLQEDGTFSKRISAMPGKFSIVIKAVNRFGRTSVIEKNIQVLD